MHNCLFLLAAEGSSIDQNSHNLSIFNIIEEVQSQGFPLIMQKIALVALFSRDSGDADTIKVALRVRLNDTLAFENTDLAVNYQGAPRTRLSITLQGLVVKGPGNLVFELTVGRQITKHSVKVSGMVGAAATR